MLWYSFNLIFKVINKGTRCFALKKVTNTARGDVAVFLTTATPSKKNCSREIGWMHLVWMWIKSSWIQAKVESSSVTRPQFMINYRCNYAWITFYANAAKESTASVECSSCRKAPIRKKISTISGYHAWTTTTDSEYPWMRIWAFYISRIKNKPYEGVWHRK